MRRIIVDVGCNQSYANVEDNAQEFALRLLFGCGPASNCRVWFSVVAYAPLLSSA
jgi:hypothetical protein